MNKIIVRRLSMVLFIITIIHGIYGAGVEISNVWTSNVFLSNDGKFAKYLIDVDVTPTIYIALINQDTYQHNVKIFIKSDEEDTWESPIINLPPNRKEKIIDAKLKFKEFGSHKIQIELIENGKIIASKTKDIYVISPIDVENITCEKSYVNESNPDVEICSSPYFTITLKNNNYSQTDYLVKTWIAVTSKNYNKDASKYENDAGVLYYGKNDSKMVYVPIHGEANVIFKIPKIIQNDDEFKIQVHYEIMGIHGYTDAPEKTSVDVNDDLNVKEVTDKYSKYFLYPISLEGYGVVKKLNENITPIIMSYYEKSGIKDDELENAINNYYLYSDEDILPRAYLKSEPFLTIINLTLKNRCDYPVSGIVSIEDNTGTWHSKKISLSKFEIKNIYVPCYTNYTGNKKINIIINSENTYVLNKTETLNVEPNKIPPVKICSITYSYNNISKNIYHNNINLFVGRNYTLYVTLINNYNETLSGNLDIIDDDFDKGVVSCPSSISFKLGPHFEKTYKIPIVFNIGANGDLKLTVKTNDSLNDYSEILHINAQYINVELKYDNNLKPKIAVVNKNPVFQYYPVAGCNNTFIAKLSNPLDESISCITWIEAVDTKGKLVAKSSKKWVYLPPKGYNEAENLDYILRFNEGFYGYLEYYAIPAGNYNNNYTNLSHPIVSKSIDVIAPLAIENLTYNKSSSRVCASISSESLNGFPVDLNYDYWINIIKTAKYNVSNHTYDISISNKYNKFVDNSSIYDGSNNTIIYKSPIYSKILHPGDSNNISIYSPKLTNGHYIIKFYVKIPNFIEKNRTYLPMILEKDCYIGLEKNNLNTLNNKTIKNIAIKKDELSSKSFMSNNSNVSFDNNKSNGNNTATTQKGLLENIYSIIKNIITGII